MFGGSVEIGFKDLIITFIGVEKYGPEKILIPWAIGREVSKTTGVITFSFQFFKLSEDHLRYLYILNTQPAKSKILAGLRTDPLAFLNGEEVENEFVPEREWLADEIHRLTEAYERLSGDYELYWTKV